MWAGGRGAQITVAVVAAGGAACWVALLLGAPARGVQNDPRELTFVCHPAKAAKENPSMCRGALGCGLRGRWGRGSLLIHFCLFTRANRAN